MGVLSAKMGFKAFPIILPSLLAKIWGLFVRTKCTRALTKTTQTTTTN